MIKRYSDSDRLLFIHNVIKYIEYNKVKISYISIQSNIPELYLIRLLNMKEIAKDSELELIASALRHKVDFFIASEFDINKIENDNITYEYDEKALEYVDYLYNNMYITEVMAESIKNGITYKLNTKHKLDDALNKYHKKIKEHILEDKTEKINSIIGSFYLDTWLNTRISYHPILIFTDKNLYVLGETYKFNWFHYKRCTDTYKVIRNWDIKGIYRHKKNKYITIKTSNISILIEYNTLSYEEYKQLLEYNPKK